MHHPKKGGQFFYDAQGFEKILDIIRQNASSASSDDDFFNFIFKKKHFNEWSDENERHVLCGKDVFDLLLESTQWDKLECMIRCVDRLSIPERIEAEKYKNRILRFQIFLQIVQGKEKCEVISGLVEKYESFGIAQDELINLLRFVKQY